MSIATSYRVLKYTLFIMAIVSLSACSHMKDNIKGVPTPDNTVPFSIGFDLEGKPVIFDQKGKRIRPQAVDFPVKATEVQSMETITAIAIKGSCFWLVYAAGKYYQIPLPDSYCG